MGRVQSVIAKANQKVSIQLAASLLAGSTALSFIFGFLRVRMLNSTYYDTYKVGLDAYLTAFTVPDFMFFLLVSGALSVSFIPVFNMRMANGNKKSAWILSSSMINFMALITLITSVLIIIFANPIIHLLAPGFNESQSSLAISMMRVIAINPFLFAIAAVIASMQQAVGRFTFFSLAPTIYNIGIIIGIMWFTKGINIFGWQVFEGGIMGVALGVVLGSIMQLVVSAIGLIGLGFDYQYKIAWRNKGFREVLRLLPARSVDQGMDYLVSIAEVNLASRIGPGAYSAYYSATTLHMAPINLIGVAISTAAFPKMTERLGQNRPDLFKKELRSVLRVIIWMALPVATITYFTRGYLVNFIKNGGDTLIAGLLGALVVAILFRSIYHIAARSFYAQRDTKTPLVISIFAIALNIGLAVWFVLGLKFGLYGLAWAASITAVVEVVILFIVMSHRIQGLFNRSFFSAVIRMAAATGLMAVVTYVSVQLFQLQSSDQNLASTLPKFAVITMISLVSYAGLSKLFRLSEVMPLIERARRILFGRITSQK